MGYSDRKAATATAEKKESSLIRVSGLWKLKSGKGLSGNIDDKGLDAIADALQKTGGKARLLVLVNKFAKSGSKDPGFVLFVSNEAQQQPGQGEVKRPNGEAAKAADTSEFAGIF